MISGGRLHRGAQGAAGDIGHIQAPGRTEPCRCGNTGCLEAVASAAAIAAQLGSGLTAQTSRDVVDLVRAGNTAATQAVRQAGREIGTVLAACVSLLNPSVIVSAAPSSQAGDSLLAGIREAIYARSLPLATTDLRVVASRIRPAGRRPRRRRLSHHTLVEVADGDVVLRRDAGRRELGIGQMPARVPGDAGEQYVGSSRAAARAPRCPRQR